MDKAKIKDYLTTIAFFGVSSIVAYQAAIMAYVPIEYSLLALVGFGILSQVAADARVKAKVAEAQADIDAAQAKVLAVNAQIDAIQGQVKGSAEAPAKENSSSGSSSSNSGSNDGLTGDNYEPME